MYKIIRIKTKLIITLTIILVGIILAINNSTTVLKLFYPLKFKEHVFQSAQKNGLDPYLVFAIIKAESGFDPKAVSGRNAKGLMQITDKTGRWGAESNGITGYRAEMLFDPETNIRLGCWYLSVLFNEFRNDIDLVICAYNGGSGNVSEWLKDGNLSNTGISLDRIPFKETDEYLKKVKEYYSVYKKLYEKSF